jgi:hypothetical protein
VEITNLEHEFVDDLFFPRVVTRFDVDGVKHYYFTHEGGSRPQLVQWRVPKDTLASDVMAYQYLSKCPAHIRAIVEEQVPIVAIMLS